MNTTKEWQDFLERANKEVKKNGYTIKVGQDDDGYYELSVINENRGRETTLDTMMNEQEVYESIAHAWCSVNRRLEVLSYRKVHGWTHDEPALIWSITNIPLFFHDNAKLSIELVEESIDLYEDRDGFFCVMEEDYEEAYRQIEVHDLTGKVFD